jgi:hypothetical protein
MSASIGIVSARIAEMVLNGERALIDYGVRTLLLHSRKCRINFIVSARTMVGDQSFPPPTGIRTEYYSLPHNQICARLGRIRRPQFG